jgi:glycosyltransferase involved in cell wall biosynthesis
MNPANMSIDKEHLPKAEPANEPTISLCMMVKNEEDSLARCLESVKGFVDEIVIVDTGSTDQTVQIAEGYEARIYHHPWQNDFSKHRNESISYASMEWILVMDADEEFFAEDSPRIKPTLKETACDYLNLQCYDLKKSGRVHGVLNQVRLFRNGLGMRYTRDIHNQLQTVGKGAYSRLRFKHYGYDLSPERMEEKFIRTTTLLLERIKKDPEDPFNYFELSSSYSMHQEYEKAIAYGELALECMREGGLRSAYFSTVFYTVAQGYFAMGNLDKAEEVCRDSLDFFDLDLNAFHFLASIYFKKKDSEKCKEMSFKYLQTLDIFQKAPEMMQGIYFNSYAKQHEIYFGLAFIYFKERNFEEADTYFQKAFQMGGHRPEKAKEIALFYLEQHMEENAVQWLEAAHASGYRDGDILQSFRRYYLNHNSLEITRSKFEIFLSTFPSWAPVRTIYGDLQIALGNFPLAASSYEETIRLDPLQKEVYMKASLAHEDSNDIQNAINVCQRLLGLFSDDSRAYLRLGKLYLQQKEFDALGECLQKMSVSGLNEVEKNEKSLLELAFGWFTGDLDRFLLMLEETMTSLNMETNITIDSTRDLGQILYALSERLCADRQWQQAEICLRLGIQIAPEEFDLERFKNVLHPTRI